MVTQLKPIVEHPNFSLSLETLIFRWTVDISGHERALLDLKVCSCAFSSVITSLRAQSDGRICIRGLPSHTVSTLDAEFLWLVCYLFICPMSTIFVQILCLTVRLKAGNGRSNSTLNV